MATISSITGTSEVSGPLGTRATERVSRADAGPQQDVRPAEPPKPSGVKTVLKEQQENKLATKLPSPEEMQELVNDLQETIAKASKDQYNVGFREDERTASYVIEIKDKDGKVVRQFPPEKVLNSQEKLDEMSGMVIDEMT